MSNQSKAVTGAGKLPRKNLYDSEIAQWAPELNAQLDAQEETDARKVERELRIKTFDKVQGWQTLEVCRSFEYAQRRVQSILENCPDLHGRVRIIDEIV